jgi:hypothetical protein
MLGTTYKITNNCRVRDCSIYTCLIYFISTKLYYALIIIKLLQLLPLKLFCPRRNFQPELLHMCCNRGILQCSHDLRSTYARVIISVE